MAVFLSSTGSMVARRGPFGDLVNPERLAGTVDALAKPTVRADDDSTGSLILHRAISAALPHVRPSCRPRSLAAT
jgi:hypothetical protein